MTIAQRDHGRRMLLEQIRQSGRVPRIALSERTGISRATVTTITAKLLAHGLIEEVSPEDGDADARRGRPRVDLRIRGAARRVVGVKVSHSHLSLVLMDFSGAEIATLETSLTAPRQSPDALVNTMAVSIAQLARQVDLDVSDLHGVAIGIAGMVEAETGLVYWSPSMSDRNVALAKLLSARLALPVSIDNDANLVAVAELRFGLGRDRNDFIVVTLESGVGMGLVIGGELYRGTRGCGAEFGHTKVHLDGALCRCGQRGCLEAYVADYALLREAAVLPALDTISEPGARVAALLDAARDGHTDAKVVVERAGRFFALGLANLVNVFDPELIILAGEQMQFDHLYADDVLTEMRKSIVQIDKPPPEVVIHKWGDLMWARGAAALALDEITVLALAEMGSDAG